MAGPYAPPVGQNGCTAIHKDSSVFVGWATISTISRGWMDVSNIALGKANIGNDTSATNKSGVNGVVSLGDNGSATLTFNGKIYDGPGADFAVFENSFDGLFLELAFVEVSSDGINFYRFDAQSLTDTSIQTSSFGNTDATNLYNLAGKYRSQYGTPFDLNELTGITGLDINNITHVRVVDVVGDITESYATYDAQNRPINDPWPTPFASGGFDLDAVGVINYTPTSINEEGNTIYLSIYPNPAVDIVYFNVDPEKNYTYRLTNISGSILYSGKLQHQLDVSQLKAGIYFIHISSKDQLVVKKIIKK
ncbi:MAG: secretion protein [Flavobacteriales bacterium]|nr:MAG: secretion protein [Flavobacteriales bacterium]